jgi:hypothetical protein
VKLTVNDTSEATVKEASSAHFVSDGNLLPVTRSPRVR